MHSSSRHRNARSLSQSGHSFRISGTVSKSLDHERQQNSRQMSSNEYRLDFRRLATWDSDQQHREMIGSCRNQSIKLPTIDRQMGRTLTLMSLNARQKRALQQTFLLLSYNGLIRLMKQSMERLEIVQPNVKSMFFTAAFVNSFRQPDGQQCPVKNEHDHAKVMVEIFDDIVGNLDRLETLIVRLRECGEKHALMRNSGFCTEILETFGELMVNVIANVGTVKNNSEGVRAWRLLLACVTDEMRFGFETKCRRNNHRCSVSEISKLGASTSD